MNATTTLATPPLPAPGSQGRLFDVILTRDVTQSAVLRVMADSPDEAVEVAQAVDEGPFEVNRFAEFTIDDGNVSHPYAYAAGPAEEVATMVYDPEADEGGPPTDTTIYRLPVADGEPEVALLVEPIQPRVEAIAAAARAMLDAFGGDVPDWLRPEAADLERALEGVAVPAVAEVEQPQALVVVVSGGQVSSILAQREQANLCAFVVDYDVDGFGTGDEVVMVPQSTAKGEYLGDEAASRREEAVEVLPETVKQLVTLPLCPIVGDGDEVEVPCGQCEGTGETQSASNGETEPCPVCDGSGTVREAL